MALLFQLTVHPTGSIQYGGAEVAWIAHLLRLQRIVSNRSHRE
jgi:hypothetical protein